LEASADDALGDPNGVGKGLRHSGGDSEVGGDGDDGGDDEGGEGGRRGEWLRTGVTWSPSEATAKPLVTPSVR
jgi:hypothetical protein